MPVYAYQAAGTTGTVEGFITADSPASGRAILRHRGLAVHRFTEQQGPRKLTGRFHLPFHGIVGFRGCEQGLNEVTHYLAMLLRAGVPLGEALGVVVRQVPRSLEPVLRRITEKVNAGVDFAGALADEPQLFDEGFVGVVRIGQASGQLETCLQRLIQLRRRHHQLKQKVSAAMAYPMIVSAVGLGVVLFLMTFVVPRITTLIAQSGRSIPLSTQILLGMTAFIRGYWWAAGLVLAVGVLIMAMAPRPRKQIVLFIERMVARLPILGDLMMKSSIAQASTMLETMLRSGLPLDEAMEITQRSIHNRILREEFARMITALRAGRPLVESSSRQGSSEVGAGVLPPVVMHMLSIGEQTGQLEEMLGELANSFDDDVEIAAKKAVSVLEPLLIVAISVAVGFIVFATIMPIIRLSGSLH